MTSSVQAVSLPEAVYAALRESILGGVDEQGAVLTEAAVSARYGVARPTAKAAIERLVSEGILRRTLHKAAEVPALSRADILDLYDSRIVIEEAALRLLAATGTVPPAALVAHRELAHSERDGTGSAYARADIAFHRALVLGQPSPRLARMHQLIMGEIELSIGQVHSHELLTPAVVMAQHQSILDAVTAADPERAASQTRLHIRTARDQLSARAVAAHEGPGKTVRENP